MEHIRTFFDMGGYAAFVWPPFAVTVLVMAGLVISSRRRLRADERLLGELEKTLRPETRTPRQAGSTRPDEATP